MRTLEVGKAYTLTQHPDFAGQAFVPLVLTHLATNNLGTNLSHARGQHDDEALGHGRYRKRLLALKFRSQWHSWLICRGRGAKSATARRHVPRR